MNLIRRMSSGLLSSKTAKELFEEEESDNREDEAGDFDQVNDDADVDDPHLQQQLTNGLHEGAGAGVRVRAPISDENDQDELLADAEEEAVEEDGVAGSGSVDSYNSALERTAASSTASFDTASSPKTLSPVGSWTGGATEEGALPSAESTLGSNPPEAHNPNGDDKVSEIDGSLLTDEGQHEELDEEVVENRGMENGDGDHGTDTGNGEVEIAELQEAQHLMSESVAQSSVVEVDNLKEVDAGESLAKQQESPESEVSQSQGRNVDLAYSPENEEELSVTARAMLTAEDEGGSDEVGEDRDEDGVRRGEGQLEVNGEEALEGIVREDYADRQALKIRAVLSDLGEGYELPRSDSGPQEAMSEENGDRKEEDILLTVRAAASEPDRDSSVETPLIVDSQDTGKTSDIDETNEFPGNPEETESSEVVPENPSVNAEALAVVSGNGSEVKSGIETDVESSDKQPEDVTETEKSFKISSQSKFEDEVTAVPVNDSGEGEEADEARDWDDEIEERDEEDADSRAERSTALAALVGAADSAGDTPAFGAAGPTLPARPVRIVRSAAPSVDPGARPVQQQRSIPAPSSSSAESSQTNGEVADGNEETREKLQAIRVKFLRLALRLGQSAHNDVVAQVLYRLGLAEQLRGGNRSNRSGGAFSFDRASAIAEEQEAAGPEELDFTCTIMVLGKTGVGKSATINSIFDEPKTGTNAFRPSTTKVQVITGNVHGIKVRVIDTPGLLPSVADQRHNEKVMASVKKFIKKQSPDIVLYFDRLDMQSRDYGDLPLLRTITDTFGTAVWFNAIVVLTHASSAPPDGSNGLPLSYEMFVAQRSHVVQQTIRQAAGDMRLMNPVSLVENHPACRVNRARQRVLPNGQVWKPQLLLLCFASKVLAEANSLLKLQENTAGKPFGVRQKVPPLPFLLSSLLQSRAQLKLPDEQLGEEDESDEDLDEDEESDEEEDYDQLPPFRRLAKEEVAELDEDNRKKYFEELVERERLFQKKMWKEEKKRRREMKKRMAEAPTGQLVDDGVEDDMSSSAAVSVPMPDMVLPPSFDSDNPSYRYRYLESANQWLVRPVLETHGWDHDNGYDGMNVEKLFVVAGKIPASVSGQITKDKKESSLNMECAASLKHGPGKVSLAGLDIQTVGKDLAYTLRSETRFSNFKGNKTTGGLAVTLLGNTVTAGMKIENRLIAGKRFKLVLNGGAMTGRDDIAFGGSLEATLRDKDYPLSRTLSTLGISVMDWHGDLAVGGNFQSQLLVGKTMMVGRANLNNRGAGQISIRASSSEQLQMALIGLLPIIRSLLNHLLPSQSQQ